MDGKQALENISITFDELGFVPTTPTSITAEHFKDWFPVELNIINQDLNRLEELEEERANYDWEKDTINALAQENQQLKKVIEMLKNKLDIEIYEIHENGVTEYYLDCSAGEVIDEQEEYDLFKEYLRNER